MRRKIGFSLFAIGALALVFASTVLHAKPAKFSWSESPLVIEAKQGTTTTIDVTAHLSKADVEDISVHVVPSLSSIVHVSPTEIDQIDKGDDISISLSVELPQDYAVGTYEGVIQLRASGNGKNGKVIAQPLPVEIAVLAYDDGLPPDPGEAGKLTLEGIDSDGDGVRDDVQRWIALESGENEGVQRALTQRTKANQHLIKSSNEISFRNEASRKLFKSIGCFIFQSRHILDPIERVQHASRFSRIVDSRFYDTENRDHARASAYLTDAVVPDDTSTESAESCE